MIKDNDTLTYGAQLISAVFKNFFSNSAEFVLIIIQNPPGKYNLEPAVK